MSTSSRTAGGLAGRAGRWSAAHPWRAIVLWVLFVVAATLAGASTGTQQLTTAEQLVGESAEAQRMLDDAGYVTPVAEFVLVQDPDGPNTGAQFDAAVADVVAAVDDTGHVSDVVSPLLPGAEAMRSTDGRSALVTFTMDGDAAEAAEHIEEVEAAVDEVAAAHPGLVVEQSGDASSSRALEETLGKDFERAHTLSIPLSLGILLLTFGASSRPSCRWPSPSPRSSLPSGSWGSPASCGRSTSRPPWSCCSSAWLSAWTTRCST